jgi:CBS domain-containing protein
MKVKDLMTKKPITTLIPGNREDVLSTLVKNNKTSLPVVDDEGNYVGVITRKMIFRKPNEDQVAMLVDKEHPVISPTADIDKAVQMLVENRCFRLPVVKGSQLVGIITPSDILSVVREGGLQDPVENYIHSTCVPVHTETPIRIAGHIIRVSAVYALPVLDDEGDLVGLVTDRDLFNHTYIEESTALTELGLDSDEDEWTWEGLRTVMSFYFETSKVDLPLNPVKDIMVKDPLTVYGKTTVSKAARDMVANDYGQLPVLDKDNRLRAVIYDLDIIECLLESGE